MPSESRQFGPSTFLRSTRCLLLPFLTLTLFAFTTGLGQYRFFENGESLDRGPEAGFLPESPSRIKIDLSGPWTYTIDGAVKGTVQIPAACDFRGSVVFQRSIELTQDQLDRYSFHLVMLGVGHSVEVSVNGEFVTTHSGGGTSVVEPLVRNLLQAGRENVIRVTVRNDLSVRSTLPIRPAVWGIMNYGGITRDIYLLGTPHLFIKDVVVQADVADKAQSAKIAVRVSVEGVDSMGVGEPPSAGKAGLPGVTFELTDKISGSLVARSGIVPLTRKGNDWEEVRSELVVQSPRLWSPENPDLYMLRCSLVRTVGKEVQGIDEYAVPTGIRKIAVAGGKLLLNGKRLLVKGVAWYEDHPTWASALTREQREKDIILIKNLGANLVRFAGRPPHPYMLNLCDRYGLLAMEELPVIQTPGPVLGTESYGELASSMLKEMITRDRNHPSVLAWGLGEEFEASHPAARPFVDSLARLARRLDGRLLYFGAVPGIDDCSDLVDIAAVSLPTRDPKLFRAQAEAWRQTHRQQPVLVAKFGAEVVHDNKNGYSDPLSQEAQARFYLQRLDLLKTLDYDGAIVWSFNDWQGSRSALTVHAGDPRLHSMGLVSAWRERRMAYDAVRANFHNEKYVALPIGAYTESAPIIYVLVGFVVLIGIAYVYNASRRFRESLNRSVLNSYNFFADVRDQRIVSLGHTTLLGVVVSLTVALVASSMLFHFRDNLVFDNLLSLLLVFDGAKHEAVTLIWSPLRCIAVVASGVFALLLLLSGAVHFLRAFVRARVVAFHAYTITMWSTAPLLILVPVGMILYRVMESRVYVIPAFVLVGVLLLWVFLRLLKGISIIFDVSSLKMYVIGLLVVVVTAGILYASYDYAQSTPIYVAYVISTLVHLQ